MSFSNRTEFEHLQQAYGKKETEPSIYCISCPKCQCQWFEQIEFMRYQAEHNLILGQPVPARPGSTPYIMLRCGRCGELVEPNIISQNRDIANRDYDNFLDTMEAKTEDPYTISTAKV